VDDRPGGAGGRRDRPVPRARRLVRARQPYVTHRHPGLWANPEGFDPHRFLNGQADALPKFAYVPFGGGPRFCIGSNFAMMEATLLLATVAQACRLDGVPGFPVEPYAMITLRPAARAADDGSVDDAGVR
jgi:cytochrome P450